MKSAMMAVVMVAAGAALAQQSSGKGSFMAQQAYDETRRLAGQMDVLQNNVDDISTRLHKLERGNGGGEVSALNARISSLEAQNADLRRRIESMRNEIVNDLTKRIKSIQHSAPAPAPARQQPSAYKEYVVSSGDTLSIVAEAFNTTVRQIREMNNMKNDNLRVGQKLKVPMK